MNMPATGEKSYSYFCTGLIYIERWNEQLIILQLFYFLEGFLCCLQKNYYTDSIDTFLF